MQRDTDRLRLAMSGYVEWIASQYGELEADAADWIRRIADENFHGDHGRIPESCAKLFAGAQLFLSFAASIGAITEEDSHSLSSECATALQAAADATSADQKARKPTAIFFDVLETLFAQGKIYLKKRDGTYPDTDPERWGWKRIADAAGSFTLHQNAELVGWIDQNLNLFYLMPTAVVNAVKAAQTRGGEHLSFNARSLAEQLAQGGFIPKPKNGENKYQIRLSNSPSPVSVWAISTNYRNKTEADTNEPDAPEADDFDVEPDDEPRM
jgi:hypothetical protein